MSTLIIAASSAAAAADSTIATIHDFFLFLFRVVAFGFDNNGSGIGCSNVHQFWVFDDVRCNFNDECMCPVIFRDVIDTQSYTGLTMPYDWIGVTGHLQQLQVIFGIVVSGFAGAARSGREAGGIRGGAAVSEGAEGS